VNAKAKNQNCGGPEYLLTHANPQIFPHLSVYLFDYHFGGLTFLFWYAEIQDCERFFPERPCVMVRMIGHKLHKPRDAQHGKKGD
jgi:hypothetical protein